MISIQLANPELSKVKLPRKYPKVIKKLISFYERNFFLLVK